MTTPRRLAALAALTLGLTLTGATTATATPPYDNCTDVWEQLGRPIYPNDPGYTHGHGTQYLDGDSDGVGCERKPPGAAPHVPAAPRHAASHAAPPRLADTGPGFPTIPTALLGAVLVFAGWFLRRYGRLPGVHRAG